MKRLIYMVVVCITLVLTGRSQEFTAFLRNTEGLPADQRQAVADAFLKETRTFPVIENDTLVHFIYHGEAQCVALAGDMTDWKEGPAFERIAGTRLWFLTRKFEPDARLDYKFVVDHTAWVTDPLNPATCTGGYGTNSQLRMPRNHRPDEVIFDPAVPRGLMADTLLQSHVLRQERRITVYFPAGFRPGTEGMPLVVFHDGSDFLTIANAGMILDNLIASRKIRPLIAVFLHPVERDEEYSGTRRKDYTKFVARELVPWLLKQYRISPDPADHALAGISNGGNIALRIGLFHPEVFGKVAALSSNVMPEIMDRFRSKKRQPLKVYTDIGRYDIGVLIPMAEGLHELLLDKGYEHQYKTWNEGHSWCNWREHLGEPLGWFFGGEEVTR